MSSRGLGYVYKRQDSSISVKVVLDAAVYRAGEVMTGWVKVRVLKKGIKIGGIRVELVGIEGMILTYFYITLR